MTHLNRAKATAIVRENPPKWMVFSVLGLAALLTLLAGCARAQDDITISHGISTFGELKYDADYPYLDYVNPDAPFGGEYSTWAFGSFDSMNPYIVKGSAAASSSIFIETLMTGTADESGSVYGLIAETLEYPSDKSWVIFNLRPEARFSDGTPVTADDVVFTHNVFVEKGIPSYRAIVGAQIASVEALDTYRVKFTFFEPSTSNENLMLAAGTSVLSAAQFENRDFAESTLDPILGTGPYVLQNLDVGKQLVYVYNPDYWGADLPINIGQNNFETIRFEYYADPTAAFEGFKAGAYTFRTENSSQAWAENYTFPAVENGWVVTEELANGNIGRAQGFFFNTRRGKFSDPRVREAIGMAFNFEWSNRTLFFGLYKRVNSFWQNSPLEAMGDIPADELAILEPFRDQLPAKVYDEPAYIYPVSGDNQIDRRLIRAAGALLDDAGWTIQDGVRKNANGEQLTIEFLNYSPLFDRIINPYLENLERLGIEAINNRVDTAQYSERVDSFDFDVMISTYANGLTPSLGLRQWYGSENADVPSRNRAGLKNEAIDALVELIISAENRDELNLRTRALDRALRALHIWVPQWFKDVHTVAYWDVYEYGDVTLAPYALGVSSWWWYSEEKAAALIEAGAF
ncbi:MAG: ABC transporter substrate-binding protein [Rhodobacteraceae bacterium]|nr:ABC transporter substrate-binding protein [Paracoccaceae bacterium]